MTKQALPLSQLQKLAAQSMDALVLIQTAHDLMPDDAVDAPHCRYLVGMARQQLEALSNQLVLDSQFYELWLAADRGDQ